MMSMMLKVPEVATFLRCGQKTVYRLILSRSLPAHKIGTKWLVHREELEQWVRTQPASKRLTPWVRSSVKGAK